MTRARRWAFAVAVLVPFVVFLQGCDLAGTTIESRIQSFVDDLNYNRAGAIGNFHPLETSAYGPISGTPDFWDADFPIDDGTDYYIIDVDSSNPLSVFVTIDGPSDFAGPSDFEFIMLKDGMTWYIEELWYWGGIDPIVQ